MPDEKKNDANITTALDVLDVAVSSVELKTVDEALKPVLDKLSTPIDGFDEALTRCKRESIASVGAAMEIVKKTREEGQE